MRNPRSILRWLTAPLVLLASIAIAAPRPSAPADIAAVSLRRLNLSGTPAAIPVALMPLAAGRRASSVAVNSAQGGAVSGTSSGPARVVVPLGDVDGDGKADLLDMRANAGTLSAQLISGGTGITRWRMTPVTRPTPIFAAVWPATINGGPDAYLLEQFDHQAKRTWTIHAIDGTNGADLWSTSGEIPTDAPSTTPPSIPPSPPSVPPSVPPVSPTALPTALPTGVPTGVPSGLPSGAPSGVPSNVPTGLPTTPAVPSGVPTTLPSDLPTGVATPTITPPAVPSEVPTTLPSDLPTGVGTPTITPPAAGRRAAAAEEQDAKPLAAYATGAKPSDVDGDGKDDFAITQHLALSLPDASTVVLAQLSTVSGAGGQAIATILAAGRNAVPYAGVAGNVLGRPGLVAVDEVALSSNALVTARMHTGAGMPVWVAAEMIPLGSIGLYDGRADLNGDGAADLLSARMPAVAGQVDTIVSVRTSPTGAQAWSRTLKDSAVVVAGGEIDANAGADVVTQGVEIASGGKIPSAVVYRALAGQTGASVYETKVPVSGGGTIGDWSARLSVDAGRIDGDATTDLMHAVNAVPATGTSEWSHAAVNGKSGAVLWAATNPVNPGAPVRANILGDAAADIVDVQESTTRYADSLVIRTASGSTGSAAWTSRVQVGGATERIRSLSVQALTSGGTSDIVITVIQRSGTGTRSLVVAVKGATGQVLWIRTN